MRNLTSEEQQRLWKPDEPPVRKILLWGLDSKKKSLPAYFVWETGS